MSSVLALRGGDEEYDSGDDEYDSDEYDEESDDDDFDFDAVAGGGGTVDADFAGNNYFDGLVVQWKKTPPLTQSYLMACGAVSVYGFMFTKNEFPSILLLDWDQTVKRLQIWRPFTTFLNLGPFGMSFYLTIQFVWQYMATLERANHDKPYDFLVLLLFAQLCMVIGYPLFGLDAKFLGHNLSTFFVYIWSRYHEGVEVNLYGMFSAKAELLPWIFLAQTFLLEGELPILDFWGIVFGHIYYYLKSATTALQVPNGVKKWYEESTAAESIRNLYKPISSDFQM